MAGRYGLLGGEPGRGRRTCAAACDLARCSSCSRPADLRSPAVAVDFGGRGAAEGTVAATAKRLPASRTPRSARAISPPRRCRPPISRPALQSGRRPRRRARRSANLRYADDERRRLRPCPGRGAPRLRIGAAPARARGGARIADVLHCRRRAVRAEAGGWLRRWLSLLTMKPRRNLFVEQACRSPHGRLDVLLELPEQDLDGRGSRRRLDCARMRESDRSPSSPTTRVGFRVVHRQRPFRLQMNFSVVSSSTSPGGDVHQMVQNSGLFSRSPAAVQRRRSAPRRSR